MSTTTTTNLGLVLPVPTVQLGPVWATNINEAFEVIDAHDHSSGKGLRVPTAGLNINADLDFNSNAVVNIEKAQMTEQTSALSGGTNANSIYSVSGNLYFTNSSGTAVQITSGGSLVAPPGNAQVFEYQAVASSLAIAAASSFVYLAVDTSTSITITLPLASAVTAGRIYIIKDVTGNANTNNITVATSGSDQVDGASSQLLQSDFGSWTIIGDGATDWYIS